MLILTIVACCCGVVMGTLMLGGLLYLAVPVVILALATRNITRRIHRTRDGTVGDAQRLGVRGNGWCGGRGPIIGRMWGKAKTSLLKGLNDLFRPSVSSQVACEQFYDSIRFFNRPQKKSGLITLANAVHTAVFAPTGVGKGVSCVIPFLLTSRESAVVVDFKGELYQKTAEHRRRNFGHKIVALDPYKLVTENPDTFNPIDSVSTASQRRRLMNAGTLLEALVVRTGSGKRTALGGFRRIVDFSTDSAGRPVWGVWRPLVANGSVCNHRSCKT